MLDNLKKKLGIVVQANEETKDDDKVVSFNVTETEEYKELLQGFTEQSAELDKVNAEVASLKKQLTQYADQVVAAEAEAKKVKMDARFASLSQNVGDVRAKAVLAATEGMDDEQFNAIADALKMSADMEANSEMFVEKGVQAETVKTTVVGERVETAEGKALKAKYQKSK